MLFGEGGGAGLGWFGGFGFGSCGGAFLGRLEGGLAMESSDLIEFMRGRYHSCGDITR